MVGLILVFSFKLGRRCWREFIVLNAVDVNPLTLYDCGNKEFLRRSFREKLRCKLLDHTVLIPNQGLDVSAGFLVVSAPTSA